MYKNFTMPPLLSLPTLLLSLAALSHAAQQYCPLLGPIYPPTTDLSASEPWHAASDSLKASFDSISHPQKKNGSKKDTPPSPLDPNTTSFAVQIFSADEADDKTLFEYYFSSPVLEKGKAGVKKVDENTVFRIGSASKLWTALLLLKEAGDGDFINRPVGEYVPELRRAAENATTRGEDAVDFVRWADVTVGELMSHAAGLVRDYGFNDITIFSDVDLTDVGFPELSKEEAVTCGATQACTRDQFSSVYDVIADLFPFKEFFSGLLKAHPTAATSTTPIYSNAAFQILGYVVENISGKSYESVLSEDLIEPLKLSGTSFSKPDDKVGVIPGDPLSSFWAIDAGDETPAGGLYSSPKDMTTVGRAILNNAILSPAQTRRWMKPTSHTSDSKYSVGAPWEIYSIFDGLRRVELYTKSGDLGAYSSMTGLLPDHKVGFTILAAGSGTTAAVAGIADIISTTIVPALELAAKEQAARRFSGVYAAADKKVNSTIVIDTDAGPGLKVKKWVSESVDMLGMLAETLKSEEVPDVRLYPTGLSSDGDNKDGCSKQSFRAIMQSLSSGSGGGLGGPFTTSCTNWLTVNSKAYGNVGLDEFSFDIGKDGEVVGISPRVLKITLKKEGR
ncbi:hypothetical protein FQN50_000004 [Emmonsiellopsis sp. PD_5]|nr:hypothetical protein FQN50_000004 [Emmonsiellopsis sp. PD_5]